MDELINKKEKRKKNLIKTLQINMTISYVISVLPHTLKNITH